MDERIRLREVGLLPIERVRWVARDRGKGGRMAERDRDVAEESSRDVGAIIRLTLWAVLVLVLVAFVVDNRQSVRVGWVFGDFEAPMYVILLGAAVVGALIGWLTLHWRRSRRRHTGPD